MRRELRAEEAREAAGENSSPGPAPHDDRKDGNHAH
jgi:hypothetical protein